MTTWQAFLLGFCLGEIVTFFLWAALSIRNGERS